MSGTPSRGRGRHVTVQGAAFNGGAGGIHIRGNVDASVTASVGGGDDELRSAVEQLVRALRHDAGGGNDDLAEVADELEQAMRVQPPPRRLLRTLMRGIERHPAITGATSGLLAAALGLVGGGG